jgi:cyanophycin synthetase
MMADLATRLDVAGRRIVVLAGPGDRRDEDLVAIAKAVAGRFDHYICRRDDNLRDRAPDEVPRIQAEALRGAGVPDTAISIIPDEQNAIEAALRMGEVGDLLLIFADSLARSWKQITKFKASGTEVTPADRPVPPPAPPPGPPPGPPASPVGTPRGAPVETVTEFNLDGLIRDERGIRMAPASDD